MLGCVCINIISITLIIIASSILSTKSNPALNRLLQKLLDYIQLPLYVCSVWLLLLIIPTEIMLQNQWKRVLLVQNKNKQQTIFCAWNLAHFCVVWSHKRWDPCKPGVSQFHKLLWIQEYNRDMKSFARHYWAYIFSFAPLSPAA